MTTEVGPRIAPATDLLPVLDALAYVTVDLRRAVVRILEPFSLSLRFAGSLDDLTVDLAVRSPSLLLIDTDLVGYPDEACRLAHGLDPDTIVLGISYYWSERDALLRDCLDGIVHKPPRSAEWGAVLNRLGLEGRVAIARRLA